MIKISKHEEFVDGKSRGVRYHVCIQRVGETNDYFHVVGEEINELKAEIDRVLGEKHSECTRTHVGRTDPDAGNGWFE